MRAMMAAGVALVLVACGGKGGEQGAADTPAAAPAAQAPAASGATHEVGMEFDGKAGHFVPDQLTIKSGDAVNFVVKSGPPHNVAFWPDSIPSGAEAALNAGMPETMAPLTGPMKVGMGETYTVSFANAPAGTYKYYCTPHLPFGMHATITVE